MIATPDRYAPRPAGAAFTATARDYLIISRPMKLRHMLYVSLVFVSIYTCASSAGTAPFTKAELLALGFEEEPKHTEGEFVWNDVLLGTIAGALKFDISRLKVIHDAGNLETGEIKIRGATVRLYASWPGRDGMLRLEPEERCSGIVSLPLVVRPISEAGLALRKQVRQMGFSVSRINPRVRERDNISMGEVLSLFHLHREEFLPVPSQGFHSDIRRARLRGGGLIVTSKLTPDAQNSLDKDATRCAVIVFFDTKEAPTSKAIRKPLK